MQPPSPHRNLLGPHSSTPAAVGVSARPPPRPAAPRHGQGPRGSRRWHFCGKTPQVWGTVTARAPQDPPRSRHRPGRCGWRHRGSLGRVTGAVGLCRGGVWGGDTAGGEGGVPGPFPGVCPGDRAHPGGVPGSLRGNQSWGVSSPVPGGSRARSRGSRPSPGGQSRPGGGHARCPAPGGSRARSQRSVPGGPAHPRGSPFPGSGPPPPPPPDRGLREGGAVPRPPRAPRCHWPAGRVRVGWPVRSPANEKRVRRGAGRGSGGDWSFPARKGAGPSPLPAHCPFPSARRRPWRRRRDPDGGRETGNRLPLWFPRREAEPERAQRGAETPVWGGTPGLGVSGSGLGGSGPGLGGAGFGVGGIRPRFGA